MSQRKKVGTKTSSNKLLRSNYFLPYNPDLKERARDLRANQTPAEKKLWFSGLRNFPMRVLRQRPIDNFIVDFYIPALKLVIEIDGDTHVGEDAQGYDEARSEILQGYGLNVIRFSNQEVMENLEGVYQQILSIAGIEDES